MAAGHHNLSDSGSRMLRHHETFLMSRAIHHRLPFGNHQALKLEPNQINFP
jgi:hypothetical protein